MARRAAVNLGQGRWEVVDQGSSNGIRINGVELRRGIIEPGDALELGDVRLALRGGGEVLPARRRSESGAPCVALRGHDRDRGSGADSSGGSQQRRAIVAAVLA
jgi:ABC transport system ATP-binding/permease protein